jgi:signal transduction histidine kinase
MVVDDTVENLRLLSGMLGEHGFEVRPVTSGAQALRAAERDPPDLVLLDINMPEMDGYEVCRRLKQIDVVRDVPVIFLTALSETADKLKAFQAGGVDYVTKPFQVEEVLARVRSHVSLRQARSELAQSYERLLSLERLRDDLVHMVVHDMRSPMSVLLSHLGFVLEDAKAGGAADTTDLEGAIKAARSLNRMASDLLDLSRLEDGKMPLEKQACNVTELASEVTSALSVLDRSRSLALIANGAVSTACDRVLTYRVLENLILNAIKHTPAGTTIKVGVEKQGAYVRVWVEDEGPGVPESARERIFEKFGTVESRKSKEFHSVGLGLAFCKLAVEAHGGSIGVDPAPVKGSVFWFTLPA